jgi:hypothetical protein
MLRHRAPASSVSANLMGAAVVATDLSATCLRPRTAPRVWRQMRKKSLAFITSRHHAARRLSFFVGAILVPEALIGGTILCGFVLAAFRLLAQAQQVVFRIEPVRSVAWRF